VAVSRRRPGPRFSPTLAALLIGSLIAGIAVTFLAAPAAPNPPSGHGVTPESPTIVIDIAVALFLVIVGGTILYAAMAPRTIRVTGVGPLILAIFLVGLSFLVLVHYIVPLHPISVPMNGTNSSSTPPPATNTTPDNGTFGPLPISGVPGWVAYLVLGLVVLAAIQLLGPALRARSVEATRSAEATTAVRRSLESALQSLADSAPKDARQIIIALYAQLLVAVGPLLENLTAATPREIELVVTRQFGVPKGPAAELTRLFEEARYSTHPFSDPQVARARTALEAALLQVRIRSYTGGE